MSLEDAMKESRYLRYVALSVVSISTITGFSEVSEHVESHRSEESSIIIHQKEKKGHNADLKESTKENLPGKIKKKIKEEKILKKVRTAELMVQLVPVLYNEEQSRKILKVLEQARERVLKVRNDEYKKITEHEAQLNNIIKDAIDKKLVPSKSYMESLKNLFDDLNKKQEEAADRNVEEAYNVVKNSLEVWQIKVIAHIVQLPSVSDKSLDEYGKLRQYVRHVLLDPLTFRYFKKIVSKESV